MTVLLGTYRCIWLMLCWQDELEHQETVSASCTASGPRTRKVCWLAWAWL